MGTWYKIETGRQIKLEEKWKWWFSLLFCICHIFFIIKSEIVAAQIQTLIATQPFFRTGSQLQASPFSQMTYFCIYFSSLLHHSAGQHRNVGINLPTAFCICTQFTLSCILSHNLSILSFLFFCSSCTKQKLIHSLRCCGIKRQDCHSTSRQEQQCATLARFFMPISKKKKKKKWWMFPVSGCCFTHLLSGCCCSSTLIITYLHFWLKHTSRKLG